MSSPNEALSPLDPPTDTQVQDSSNVPSHEPQLQLDQHDCNIHEDITSIVSACIRFLRQNNVTNPVEMLRKAQTEIVTGRALEVEDNATTISGETNYITVDRNNLLETGFEEISSVSKEDITKTLEVQFYNEQAAYYGGPRKEFFRLVLLDIKEKHFAQGIKELLAEYYKTVGLIFALNILQNGPMQTFLSS